MATRHDYDPKALTAARQREAAKRNGKKLIGRGSGLTPRVRKAIEFLVHGFDEDRSLPVTLEAAANRAGITARAFRRARNLPAVDIYYQQEMVALRNGERPASLRAIASIRDDTALKATAAGNKVRLDAAKSLAFDPPGQQVNVSVGIGMTIETPGYVIDLDAGRARHLERLERFIRERGIVIDQEYSEDELQVLAIKASDTEIVAADYGGDSE